MSVYCPCKDCPKDLRNGECHTKCPGYKQFVKERAELKKVIDANKEVNTGYIEFVYMTNNSHSKSLRARKKFV